MTIVSIAKRQKIEQINLEVGEQGIAHQDYITSSQTNTPIEKASKDK